MDIVTRKFQFTHPGRGATDMYADLLDSLTVSIHAPREGCDDPQAGGVSARSVSIHAPREGCDNRINNTEVTI